MKRHASMNRVYRLVWTSNPSGQLGLGHFDAPGAAFAVHARRQQLQRR